jgi:hypothetical protein
MTTKEETARKARQWRKDNPKSWEEIKAKRREHYATDEAFKEGAKNAAKEYYYKRKSSETPEQKQQRLDRRNAYFKAWRGKSEKRKQWVEETKLERKEYFKNHDKNRNRTPIRKGYRFLKLLQEYGLSYDQYWAMYKKQQGNCAICGDYMVPKEGTVPNGKTLMVDHCHKTNKARGLLCGDCNMALGKFKDSTDMLKAAIKYLEEC